MSKEEEREMSKEEEREMSKYIQRKDWLAFYESGLFVFINTFLHIFGWCLVAVLDDGPEGQDIIIKEVFPARTSFRGIPNKSYEKGYIKVTEYLYKHIDELKKEVMLEENGSKPKRRKRNKKKEKRKNPFNL